MNYQPKEELKDSPIGSSQSPEVRQLGEVHPVASKPSKTPKSKQSPKNHVQGIPKTNGTGPQLNDLPISGSKVPISKKRTNFRGVHNNLGGLTPMQAKYLKGVLAGKTKVDAMAEAGYSPNSKPNDIERQSNGIREAMRKALERQGLTEDVIAYHVAKGLGAMRKSPEDFYARERYLRLAGEYSGTLGKGADVAVQIGLISMPEKDASWNQKKSIQVTASTPEKPDEDST